MFLGFSLDAWITIFTVLGMFAILLFTKLRSDIVFLGAIGVLYVTGVLDAKEAFSGFSGTSVISALLVRSSPNSSQTRQLVPCFSLSCIRLPKS